jgi:alpha,alpha-trehalase
MIQDYFKDRKFGQLFHEVQKAGIFNDSKTFADAVPKGDLHKITEKYFQQKFRKDFDLKVFIKKNFEIPGESVQSFTPSNDILTHIENLWELLTRKDAETEDAGSLIPLPFPYVVPGGRFREIYYWDSYFTMLGLARSGRWDMVIYMVKNFKYLIDSFGHIPNGNRLYYLSRSQPPFFALMVELLAQKYGEAEVYPEFLDSMEKEYAFWMYVGGILDFRVELRLIHTGEAIRLNRYYDAEEEPRPESYAEDLHMAKVTDQNAYRLWRNIRAACESGWDFSSRWMKLAKELKTIQTIDILPVDLNALMYKMEKILQRAHELEGNEQKSAFYRMQSEKRKLAMQQYFWNEEAGWYFDYNLITGSHTGIYSLAACYPLWMGIADASQATRFAHILEQMFLKPGGLVTTTVYSGQQWDAPNGWAPLQWIAVKGLENYGYIELADEIRRRWMHLVEKVFRDTGKLMEKYNVEDLTLEAGGGEYPVQDGFGWTNGVYLDFYHTKRKKS